MQVDPQCTSLLLTKQLRAEVSQRHGALVVAVSGHAAIKRSKNARRSSASCPACGAYAPRRLRTPPSTRKRKEARMSDTSSELNTLATAEAEEVTLKPTPEQYRQAASVCPKEHYEE
eukprot:2244570-Pyramimonas_sp.AAC.1